MGANMINVRGGVDPAWGVGAKFVVSVGYGKW